MVNRKHSIHDCLDRLETESIVYHWGHCRSHSSHKVCVGKNEITELRLLAAVLETCALNDVSDLHI